MTKKRGDKEEVVCEALLLRKAKEFLQLLSKPQSVQLTNLKCYNRVGFAVNTTKSPVAKLIKYSHCLCSAGESCCWLTNYRIGSGT